MSKRKDGRGPALNGLGFKKARASVNRSARDMERVREGGYRALDSAIGRLYKRLHSTQSGQRRSLTAGNERSLEKILAATARGRAANRRTTHTAASKLDRYTDSKGMVAGDIARTGSRMLADELRAGKNAEAGATLGRTADRTAQGVADIFAAGAQEQEANANMMAAEALQQRTTEDVALIAQQRHDVAMQEMQARINARAAEQEARNARKMALFNHRLATGDLDETNSKLAHSAVSNLAQSAVLINDLRSQGMDTATIEARIMAGVDPASPEGVALQRLILSLTSDTTEGAPDDAAQEILDIITSVPGWDKMGGKKKNATKAWIRGEIQGIVKETEAKSVKTTAADSPAVGSSYEAFRKAELARAENDLAYDPPSARDTTINWVKENAEAALLKVFPENKDVIADVVEEFVEGNSLSAPFIALGGKTLPEKARKAIKNVFDRLPEGNENYGQGVFSFDSDDMW